MTQITPDAIGIGLRIPHYSYILEEKPKIDFFEIISENFMELKGLPYKNLKKILEQYPVSLHGTSLGIASMDSLDWEYLRKLKELCKVTQTPYFTDHLCWTHAHGIHYHDLLPLPYTLENAHYIIERVKIVQDYVGLPFGLENLSSYVQYADSEMTEWEFYNYIVKESGCFYMLDFNNIYVSSKNHTFEAMDYVQSVDWSRVLQCHVAGHTEKEEGYILDTHDHPVCESVWKLYREGWELSKQGFPTLLEWDDHFLSFEETHQEALKAKDYRKLKTFEEPDPPEKLVSLQSGFGQSMREPLAAKNEKLVPNISEYASSIDKWVRFTEEKTSRRFFSVYNEQYWYRVLSVMQESHPLLRHILTVWKFNHMILDYLTKSPPKHYSLNHLGSDFRVYLENVGEPWGTEQNRQIAEFESWYYTSIVDTIEEPLGLRNYSVQEALQKFAKGVSFHPSFKLYQEKWNIVESFYIAYQDHEDKKEIILNEEVQYWALVRLGGKVVPSGLNSVQFKVLQSLHKYRTLEKVFDELENSLSRIEYQEVEQNLTKWFQKWVTMQWFSEQ